MTFSDRELLFKIGEQVEEDVDAMDDGDSAGMEEEGVVVVDVGNIQSDGRIGGRNESFAGFIGDGRDDEDVSIGYVLFCCEDGDKVDEDEDEVVIYVGKSTDGADWNRLLLLVVLILLLL